MKHLFFLVFVMFSLVSCNDSEKSLVAYSLKVKTEKGKFLEKYEQEGLTLDALVLLKTYSDNFLELTSSLKELVKNKNARRSLLKFLKKEKEISSICSQYILNETSSDKLFKDCNAGHFNVCPLSFSKFFENKNDLLKAVKSVANDQVLAKTDCNLN